MKMNIVVPALCIMAATLAACGGGGDDGPTAAPVTSTPAPTPVATPAPTPVVAGAEGAYIGTFTGGREHDTVVLENDQFYTIYGRTVSAGFAVEGFLQGNGKSNNGSFSATDVVDSTTTTILPAATLTATYSPGASLNGTLVEGGASLNFTSTGISSAVFNYGAAPSLANIAGTWQLTALRGTANTFTVASTGAFTAVSGSCSFAGAFAPRASGKNIFDVTMTFGGAPCTLAGQSIKGIAISYLLTSGQRQLIVAGLDAGRTNSAAFFGVR